VTVKASSGSAGKLIAAVVVLLVLVVGGVAWWKHSPAAPAGKAGTADADGSGAAATSDKSAIIVADFVNQTGDPVFETTLNQALGVQLGQSPVLDIVSQQHLRQSLQYLGRKPDETITPAIAREIGEREGIKAILTGTISKLGNEYLITLAAQNTATGDQIASVEAQAADKDKVLDALNTAAAQMRAKLGESLASIAKLNTPFGQATTPSLEAFRAYALGDAAHEKGNDIPEAQDHYKRALELDPKLAMAYARLGVILLNSGQHGKAMEYFTKAHQLSGDVSERERLYIEGHYYSEVLGNMGKAIETLQVAAQEYPLQVDNFVNLGALYETTGEPEKAQDYLLKALKLQPDEAVGLADVLAGYVQTDQLAEAEKIIADEKKLGINDTGSYQYQLALYGVKGDKAGLQKLLAETAGRPDQFLMTSQMGVMQAQWGQFKTAVASLKRASEEAGASGAPDAQAGLLLNAAWAGWPIGECDDPAGAVKQALAFDKSKPTQIAVAATEAYCGNAKAALPALDALEKKYPDDTLIQKEIVPQGRAYLALQGGDAQKALDLLARSQAFDLVSPGPYLRGLAFLQLKDAASALAAFKIATKYKGVSYLSESNLFYPMNYYALSLLGLGRAYAMAGDKVNAKAAYDKFFAEWKDADPGLAVMAQAKKEYASL
jgi:tetratricopeptide (TPR) repeat protein